MVMVSLIPTSYHTYIEADETVTGQLIEKYNIQLKNNTHRPISKLK